MDMKANTECKKCILKISVPLEDTFKLYFDMVVVYKVQSVMVAGQETC